MALSHASLYKGLLWNKEPCSPLFPWFVGNTMASSSSLSGGEGGGVIARIIERKEEGKMVGS